jgi:hypothetical protein
MLQIRPTIKLLILGGIFFVLFLNLITYVNSVSSLRNQHSALKLQKEQDILEQENFQLDILKTTREEVNSGTRSEEGLVRINPNEIKRPIDIQKPPENEPGIEGSQSTSTEIGIIGR